MILSGFLKLHLQSDTGKEKPMKIGKVSENVLKRSILKQLHTVREEVLVGAAVGEDCAVLQLLEDEVFVVSQDPTIFTKTEHGFLAVHKSLNNLAAQGATPIGILVSMILPERVRESHIKSYMEEIMSVTNPLQIQVLGGHTEVSDAVSRPVVTITAIGKTKKGNEVCTCKAKPDQDIVITKWIGLEGTIILAKEKEEELQKKYPKHFVEEAKMFAQHISVLPEAATAVRSGVSAMHNLSECGVFGALWELAESAGVGLEIDLKKLPIKQTTIEICEYFDMNPYLLKANGSMLMVCDNGYDLVRELEKQGIVACVVGKITDNNDRIVKNGEETRYLEPPKADELYSIQFS